jgi:DNA primase
LQYKQDILGFVQGLLSTRTDKEVNFGETLKFAKEFLNFSLSDVNVDEYQQITLMERANNIFSKKIEHKGIAKREEIRSRIQIPAPYYISRGFLPETLDKFDVGLCSTPNKPMTGRVVVPVYDDDHKVMIGCVGRAVNPNLEPKWINSKGFNSGASLYNYWYSKNHILESQVAILVEGQGDVWRLDEAGIYNVVGIFGCSLGDQQRLILERSGALKLVVMTDADEAGQLAREKIAEQCRRMYNIQFIDLSQKDVGDMSVDEINSHIKPQLGA